MKQSGRMPAAVRGRQEQKRRKGSSTTGKSKGLVPDHGTRAMVRCSRSYKWPGYADWCRKIDEKNHRKPQEAKK